MPARLLRSLSNSSSSGLLGGRRRLLPGRTKSLGAERRVSELNIIGHEAIVSTQYTLQKLSEAQKNSKITKLELEDLVNRHGETVELFTAVQNLLARDSGRAWQYIKFMDSLCINNDQGAADQWKQYAEKKQALWDQIGRHAENKPIMFQVKLEVAAGTTVSVLRGMLRVLHGLKVLTRIDCGGALYGINKAEVPNTLADLCSNHLDDSSTSQTSENEPYLRDMIVFTLSCMTPDSTPINKAVVFLRKCNRRLRSLADQKATDQEEEHEIDMQELDQSSAEQEMDGSLSVQDLVMANERERQHSSGGSSRLSHSSRGSHHRRSPKRTRPRRTKSCIERGSNDSSEELITIDEEHQKKSNYHSSSSLSSSRHSHNRSLKRIKRKDQTERLHHSCHSFRRTQSLGEKECPDYDWSHNRASSCSLDIPHHLFQTQQEAHNNKNKTKPDFRWDKPSKPLASKPRRSTSPVPREKDGACAA